jgi:3'(2'), 5'-bisphosphate nucleotidase
MDYNPLLKLAIDAALKAGEEILSIYETNFYVETKSDNTPVTAADKASGKTIEKLLESSGIPVISEEETLAGYELRKHWTHAWIVDPLDGTKEFVKRNGEFAVNIALVENGKPVIGVIYAPVLKELYYAAANSGSFKLTGVNGPAGLTSAYLQAHAVKLPSQKLPKNYTVVASRSHLSREVNERIAGLKNMYGVIDVVNIGSSIKQCWVADGRAHEYPRFGTTMEWDTAAGQCILEQIGGALLNFETGLPLVYNKPEMRNSYFIAKAVM